MSSSRGNFETRYPHVLLTFVHPSHRPNLDPESLDITIDLHQDMGTIKKYNKIIKKEDLKEQKITEIIEYLQRQEDLAELKEPLSYLLQRIKIKIAVAYILRTLSPLSFRRSSTDGQLTIFLCFDFIY